MFKPLRSDEIEKIHRMSLKVLEKTGIEVDSDEALTIFKDGGAQVVSEKNCNHVRIPPLMVEKALKSAPGSWIIYGRKEGSEVRFERGNPPLFGPSGVPFMIYDPETGVSHEAGLKDFVSIIKLLDGLPNVDKISDPCTITDIPIELRDISTFFHLINNTCKPISIDFSGEAGFKDAIMLVDMLKKTVFEGKTFVSFGFCPVISPLKTDKIPINQMIEAIKAGIPVGPITMVQSGVSAPATLAGTLIIMNAEILALIVLAQTTRPGVPILYGTIPGITNFMTGEMLTASPELPLLNAAASQLAEYYGLPNWATAGRTDSKILDIQAGYEQSFPIPWVALSGATYISAVGGFLESVCALSFEKFVIDDEIVGMVKRVLKGIDTSDEHCALDLILSIGPGGNFLGEEHTVKHMRSDFFSPSVSEISDRDEWIRKGKPTALKRARERAQSIIASHSTPPLPDDVIRQIKDAFPDIVMGVS